MITAFSDTVRYAMALANREAERLGHDYIGPEHVLLGLIQRPESFAMIVLAEQGVTAPDIRRQLESEVPKPGSTPLTKLVLEAAIAEARAAPSDFVASEHLLLGMFAVPESLAGAALDAVGLKSSRVRDQISQLMGRDGFVHPERPPAI